MKKNIPEEFLELALYVEDWALATHDERYEKRGAATAEELRKFYDAMLPRLEEILEKLDEYPVGKIPADVEDLFFMALSMAEISPHIELYKGDPAVPHSFQEDRMIAVEGRERG